MKRTTWLLTIAALLLGGASQTKAAYIIDTSSAWNGSTSSGWHGSSQSLTVVSGFEVFDSIGFYFDRASFGRTFDFVLSDAREGGSVIFSTAFTVRSGVNVIHIGERLTPGQEVFALLDYRGFAGRAVHVADGNPYAGGTSSFTSVGRPVTLPGSDHRLPRDAWGHAKPASRQQSPTSELDLRFIATFSDQLVLTPEPSSLALLGMATATFGAYFGWRRKRSVAA